MSKSEKPLAGLNVLITRARGQSEKFRQLLVPLGAEVSELPVIEITPAQDFADLDRGLNNLSQYDWLVFASKNAVEHTLARARTLGIAVAGEPRPKLAAIGPATAEELAKNSLTVDFCPSSFVAEFLIDEFPGYPDLYGVKVFLPKTNIGRTLIADKLTASGALVDTAIAYLTALPAGHADLAKELVLRLKGGKIDVITLASAQSARNLAELIKVGLSLQNETENGADTRADTGFQNRSKNKSQNSSGPISMDKLLSPVKIAVIGPVTAVAAREALGKVDIEAAEYSLSGLTEALLASLKFEQKEP
jgi:uroporphyrinogen-III synthase